ncbi:tetratricopeptide repeat protein [Gluconacetobacter tumulisoli]|uniref:Tetratricopeptide repeat protein n=1 Tax=Gluconacetobacter tumulisoli TaxID=1286189 RepID=A0A7W4KAE6_9PROT|nr:tetratricopeptide repeat protein [Gluconacetobacter tumulisoli]MBB2203307.1 tetratricopeptide repeat protein [Gluconacetobacter tumulisoli]
MKATILLILALFLSACTAGKGGGTGGSVEVARAALRGGAPQIALRAVSSLLAGDPNNAHALLVQGDALTALGRLGQAEWSYRAVLSRDPRSVGAWIGLGRCLLASNPAEAEIQFQEAVRRDPRNAVALNDLGVARDLLRRHAEAQSAYRRALAADPEMIGAQVNLALSLAMSGRMAEAEHMMRPYGSDSNASSKLRHDLAAVLAMGGDRAEAARILSADLSPAQVSQALSAYLAARDQGDAAALPPTGP